MHCVDVNWLVKWFGKQLIVLCGGLLKSCDFGEIFFEPIGDEKLVKNLMINFGEFF
jgi:hypothetical protein